MGPQEAKRIHAPVPPWSNRLLVCCLAQVLTAAPASANILVVYTVSLSQS